MASMAAYCIIRAKVNSGHLRILNISLYMNLLDRFPFQTVQSGAGAGEDGTWMVQFCLSPPILSFFGSVFPKLQQDSPRWVSESGEHLRPPPLTTWGRGGGGVLVPSFLYGGVLLRGYHKRFYSRTFREETHRSEHPPTNVCSHVHCSTLT